MGLARKGKTKRANKVFYREIWKDENSLGTLTTHHYHIHLSLSWAKPIQSIPHNPISPRFILILFSHLFLGLVSRFLSSGFLTNNLCALLFSPFVLHAPPISFSLILLFLVHRSSWYVARTVRAQKGWRDRNVKNTNSVAWVRERTIPTERPPLVGEVYACFCG
jgi:hypothetical protein